MLQSHIRIENKIGNKTKAFRLYLIHNIPKTIFQAEFSIKIPT